MENTSQILPSSFENIDFLLRSPEIRWALAGFLALLLGFIIFLVVKWRSAKKQEELNLFNAGDDRSSLDPELNDVKITEKSPHLDQKEPAASEKSVEHKWIDRLRSGLSKTRHSLTGSLSTLFGEAKLDEELIENIQEILFRADIGVKTAETLTHHLQSHFQKDSLPAWEEVKKVLEDKIKQILDIDGPDPLNLATPSGILIIGVNGAGKTTTIGKMAAYFQGTGKSVLLCAGDTYRAAAIDQLAIWADRLNLQIIKQQPGSDPAAVAFDGVKAAKSRGNDVILIDTAGRLHNKKELMDELGKVKKVTRRELGDNHYKTWLVVDATTGQNAIQQVKTFHEMIDVDGLIVTKLDGTAKGGAVVGICDQLNIPIKFIGVGESKEDLQPFQADEFARSLFGQEAR